MTISTVNPIDTSARPAPGLGLPLAIVLVSAPLVGALFVGITYQYQLLFFSALVPAMAGFAVMCYVTWQGRIHDRLSGIVLGVMFGLLAYASFQGVRYYAFRQIAADAFSKEYDNLTPADADKLLDEYLI